MTCIIGIVEKSKVWMGGDSAGTGGHYTELRCDSKVFKVNDVLFGCAGSYPMIQTLKFDFVPPEHPHKMDTYRYICTLFLNSFKEFCSKHKFKSWQMMIGYRGRLFIFHEDFQVGEFVDKYTSIGSGRDFALGAMNATITLSPNLSAKDKIKTSLTASTYFCNTVRPPFVIESI